MQNADIIRVSAAYIERNLKTDITPEELAQMAGYSVWHYQRLFAQMIGVPLAVYIKRRRLDRALEEINARRKATDVAMEYGFDTYAGFYKAFMNMYGCSPKKYLSLYGTHKSKSEVSFMYSEIELRKILSNWDIPEDSAIGSVKVVDGTQAADKAWKIGKSHILKTGDRAMLFRNLGAARAIEKHGLSASVPVPTKNGDDFVEGQDIFVLLRKVKGEPLSKEERFGANCGKFGFQYGKAIAMLHNALADEEEALSPYEQNLFGQVAEYALPNVQKQNIQWEMGIPESFFKDYIENFGKLFEKLPKQLIHRDPNPSNILFSGGEVSGFTDFELSERNVRLWDSCYCATGILSEQRNTKNVYDKFPEILENILKGYDSVNPLTAEEKQAVYYVICSIQIICTAHFENVNQYKDLARTNREMLKYIIAQKEWIDGIFIA